MTRWPACRQCGDALERGDSWTCWRCAIHGAQNPPSRLGNVLALIFLIVLGIAVAIAGATIIFFAVAWLLTEGTTP